MKKYYTDGSSTIGVKSAHAVVNEKGRTIEYVEVKAPNDRTNNEEEYLGVIAALRLCHPGDVVFTDSLLVVNQIYGKYKVKKEHLKPLCQIAQELIQKNGASVIWIKRESNLAGKFFE